MAKIILSSDGFLRWSNRGIVEILRRKGVLDKAKFYQYVRRPDSYRPDTIEISMSEYIAQKYLPHRYDCKIEDENWRNGFDERTDPDAIAVLEEKGSEFCSSPNTKLFIEEYDSDLFIAVIEGDEEDYITLIPNLTEKKVRECNSIDGVVELLRKMGALHRDNISYINGYTGEEFGGDIHY